MNIAIPKKFYTSLNQSNSKSWNLPLFGLRLIICRNSLPEEYVNINDTLPKLLKKHMSAELFSNVSQNVSYIVTRIQIGKVDGGPLMTHLISRSE